MLFWAAYDQQANTVLLWAEDFTDRFIDLVSPTPLLVVTPGQWDIMHRFDHIKEMWQRAGEPKKLIPLACEQMEVYLPPWQTKALEHAEAWFKEWL